MRSFITFDKEAELGYIYVLPPSRKIKIESTDELEVNEDIMLDVDVEDRIVGIELFGDSAHALKELAGTKKIYSKSLNEDNESVVYSLRLSDKEVNKTFNAFGLSFCFSDDKFEEFVGFDINDISKYDEKLLDKMVK
ncbi:DUF2283 domain-containing protein [Bacillus licheniformis]|uniref:DUF2283 domain-containing protein n=1 Tax=Bacillus TaxID=1386 RepID=UPI0009272C57|nr:MULTISPECIES: DUF2283 domain-containing protein [Bacillus]MEC2046287.1 DUF2283 domain-containing protein [Bacillus licheniformis]MEC5235744.1 DUF2283 domain-containing protein [Bacillus licheniformis]MED4326118.1 DUF2283 domain-containing protein [Bacillus licheniformis]MED4507837.1 DUF2283 domain-containing protein [Bacillus licheniformis]MED4548879.1 DUF2283 domain-containing protein [Bacillus licheniformis]